jgi:tetratricopeptide (TPR) repeat protein
MKIGLCSLTALMLALPGPATGLAGDTVRAWRGTLTLPTYPWAAVKHPYFRGTDGVNIYPYPMLDFLSREKTNRTYQTVVLENEYLRLTILPELGGKVHEVLNKTTGRPMFYVNHVIKPALIGQAGAWTSGGIEWNTGPQGHTVGCMQPVEVRILPREKDGSQSVAIGETERIYGTKWTVVVTLRPGRSFLEERIRIYNPTEYVRPYYFWNCTAVPNTPGFRFIYPMTLGTDHGAEKFFNWPIHEGKDLSRGTNYQDAASIFAWHCDQDFFGSYNDDLDSGVVAYANHHQLPGKKAWTWGWGGYGTMHQADLTDADGPYNEVQTGPLLTQGEVGRLDPCEAIEWREWWYPIHGLGGFTFANKDVAVNAAREGGKLRLRLLGTGTWKRVQVRAAREGRSLAAAGCNVTPRQPVELALDTGDTAGPVEIELGTDQETLARFRLPLDLPARQPPEQKQPPQTAAESAQAGWQAYLFARYPDAESRFRAALEQDPKCVEALLGLANLNLDRNPAAAADSARAALAVAPDNGRAWFALAVAEHRQGREQTALDAAWQAALDPATAVAARVWAAKLLLRQRNAAGALEVLAASGPWQSDPVCRNLLAFAHRERGNQSEAARLAAQNLALDPLDSLARQLATRGRVPADPSLGSVPEATSVEWPARYELLDALRREVRQFPNDGHRCLRLGHLLFHLGRHDEGREMWKKAAELGAEPVIAYRALGMAAKTLDRDLAAARAWLEKANQADPRDCIVARDLARVLFELADKAGSDAEKRALTLEARDRLQGAFEEGKGRSDFVALLARAHSRLGDYAATARLLDSVRITIWEGAREAHDLFEEAHLALGDEHFRAGRFAEALAEFNRALEYPANLATGRLENAREAHIHWRRGNALAALGRQEEARAAWRLAAEEPPSDDPRKEEARRQARAALDRAAP